MSRMVTTLLAGSLLAISRPGAGQPPDPHPVHRHAEANRELERINQAYDEATAAWRVRFAESDVFSPGMTVADIGAGAGELATLLAGRVGPAGHVFANEIDEVKVSTLEQLCRRERLDNVTVVLGRDDDPRLPPGLVEVAVMVEVFHHLTKPSAMLAATLHQLAAGGRLIIVEPDVRQPDGIHQGCYADPALARTMAEHVGFRFERIDRFAILDLEFFALVLARPGGIDEPHAGSGATGHG